MVAVLILIFFSLRNTPKMAMAPVFLMQGLTIAINKSDWAQRLYVKMNDTYSPTTIHIFGTFLITSLVYWALGLLFMIADLTERPKWLMKYKVQPWKRVGPKEYFKICLIVLRNQIFVNVPLSLTMGYYVAPWRGMRTGLPLPGTIETIATWWFCLFCTEVCRRRWRIYRSLADPAHRLASSTSTVFSITHASTPNSTRSTMYDPRNSSHHRTETDIAIT